jgi:hypothetical protein
MSNGDAAPGGALSVGEFGFDDATPQFSAASNILCGDSLYSLLLPLDPNCPLAIDQAVP